MDVRFGEHPWTTLESARAFRTLNPSLRVIGVELDARRAEEAGAHSDARTDFRQGGFTLPLRPGESARLVRAMNLLRTYPAGSVEEAHRALGEPLREGGLLVEGSSDTYGGVLVAHLLRRRAGGLLREAMLFHTAVASAWRGSALKPLESAGVPRAGLAMTPPSASRWSPGHAPHPAPRRQSGRPRLRALRGGAP